MRLDPRLLMGLALGLLGVAQERPRLPWEGLQPLSWQAGPVSEPPSPAPLPRASQGPLRVSLSEDGTLQVREGRGLVRLQAGLPGRPIKAWRDGGLPLPVSSGTWNFPVDSPLSQGLGGLRWCAQDFRPFLSGLLWVLEDGEGVLTVVHPATARLMYLPLPPGRDLELHFLPDRLEVVAGAVDRGAPRQWVLPWMGLLPRLAALGPHPSTVPAGTALSPFPRE